MSGISKDSWNTIEALLDGAMDLEPAARAEWLNKNCSDPAIRAEVERLLAADAQSGSAVDALRAELPASGETAAALPREGDVLGQYRLLKQIGEGGMASVYLAERVDGDFQQQVALKLMRHGLYSAEAHARFRRERQILARLEHPNIARLIDGGMTALGVPYFAMEYVEGRNIRRHCEQAGLDQRARLELFRRVCAAVDYAHRHLIVHRDLKPSNIMVGKDGELKLLDFGIAKLLDEGAGGSDAETRTEWRRLTPDYAAPEQWTGAPVTTATDVYALGAVLHEMLTGTLPPRSNAEPAGDRVPGKTQRPLRGDLGLIVATALQREPEQRYASVTLLDEDIRSYLAGLPIHARGESLRYRMGKFVRRHALAVAASVAAITALAATTGFALQQAAQARAEAQRADNEAQLARKEAVRAKAVRDFLIGLFESATPGYPQPSTLTAEMLLDRAGQRIVDEVAQAPDVRLETMGVIGDLERRLGRSLRARALLTQAVSDALQQFGKQDVHTLDLRSRLSRVESELGDYKAAQDTIVTALQDYGADRSPPNAILAEAWLELSITQSYFGDHAESVDTVERAIAMQRDVLGENSEAVGTSYLMLGDFLSKSGQLDAGLKAVQDGRKILKQTLGDEHLIVADANAREGMLLRQLGRNAEAEVMQRAALDITRRVYKEPNGQIALHLNDLGVVQVALGKLDEAYSAFGEALAIQRKLYPPKHSFLATTLSNLNVVNFIRGDFAAVEPALREVLAIQIETRGDDHELTNSTRRNLGKTLVRLGKFEEAEQLLQRALRSDTQKFGRQDSRSLNDLHGLTQLNVSRGTPQQALPLGREVLAEYLKTLAPDHVDIVSIRKLLGEALLASGNAADALLELNAGLQVLRSGKAPSPKTAAELLLNVGLAEWKMGNKNAALEHWREARAVLQPAAAANGELLKRIERQLTLAAR